MEILFKLFENVCHFVFAFYAHFVNDARKQPYTQSDELKLGDDLIQNLSVFLIILVSIEAAQLGSTAFTFVTR